MENTSKGNYKHVTADCESKAQQLTGCSEKISSEQRYRLCNYLHVYSGITLEGNVSNVIALDQPKSLFHLGKRQECHPNFPQSSVFVISNLRTCHQLKFDLGRSSTRYPSGLHKKNRYVVEDLSRFSCENLDGFAERMR